MYVDNPEAVKRVLPHLLPDEMINWTPASQAGPEGILARTMGLDSLLRGRSGVGDATLTAGFWHDVFLVADAPRSQYDALRDLVGTGTPLPGSWACVALQGRSFHGQHGRRWAVLPGNLHLSAVLVCDLPVVEYAPLMPALPAVAVAEAVADLGAGILSPGIKWVNDVLLSERKVGGSLTALRTCGGRITAVVVGIGLNVAQTPLLPAGPQGTAATSLAAELTTAGIGLESVLRGVLDHLAARFSALEAGGQAELLADYRQYSLVVGRRVCLWPDQGGAAAEPVCGEVLGIEPDLGLRLAGQTKPVTTGRLTFLPREGT